MTLVPAARPSSWVASTPHRRGKHPFLTPGRTEAVRGHCFPPSPEPSPGPDTQRTLWGTCQPDGRGQAAGGRSKQGLLHSTQQAPGRKVLPHPGVSGHLGFPCFRARSHTAPVGASSRGKVLCGGGSPGRAGSSQGEEAEVPGRRPRSPGLLTGWGPETCWAASGPLSEGHLIATPTPALGSYNVPAHNPGVSTPWFSRRRGAVGGEGEELSGSEATEKAEAARWAQPALPGLGLHRSTPAPSLG